MHRSEGASGGKHSYSQAEKFSYCDFINQELSGDPDLVQLPMDPNSDDLFTVIARGLILPKLINKTFPDTIDESKLSKEPKNKYQVNENHEKSLAASVTIGCRIVNIGAEDLSQGVPHLVLGVLWQIIKRSLMAQIERLDLGRLMESADENLTKVPPEQIILRWFNYHLKNAGHHRMVTNFTEDIKDAECYAVLLAQIAPDKITSSDLEGAFRETDFLKRSEIVLEWAGRLNCRRFVTANDIVEGNPKLNLAFVATLFKEYPSLGPTAEELAAKKALELESRLDDVEALLADTLVEKDQLLSELSKTKMDFDDLEKELGNLQLEFDNLKDEKEQLASEKVKLEELLDSVTSERDSLTSKVQALETEKDDLFAQLEKEIGLKLDLENEVLGLKTELSNVRLESEKTIHDLQMQLESETSLKNDYSSKLDAALAELDQTRQNAAAKEEELLSKLEEEINLNASLTNELNDTKRELDETRKAAREAEQTKDDLFKLLTETVTELETSKANSKAMEEKLRAIIDQETRAKEEAQQQLQLLREEYEQAKADWDAERARLLERIRELEAELAELRNEMRMRLELAEKEKEEALATARAEMLRALSDAEAEKDIAIGKVRLLLSGNQKQGNLYKQETSLVGGLVWKKRFFVLKDNLISWYSREKDIATQKPKGVLYCDDIRTYECDVNIVKREYSFELSSGPNKVIVAAESPEDMREWMNEVRVAKKKKVGQSVVASNK